MDSLAIERSWLNRGAALIAGTDEVGRGAWAGPVVAGVVAVAPSLYRSLPADLRGIDDSKLLTPKRREALAPLIMAHAAAWGLGATTSREIASAGFGAAVRLAIRRAYQELATKLPQAPDVLLTDAVPLRDVPVPVEVHDKADQRCLAVAMASILAKVHRDRLMCRIDPVYPHYDFAHNKGYGTRSHQRALLRFGPCAIHRASFRPVMRAASALSMKYGRVRPAREKSTPESTPATRGMDNAHSPDFVTSNANGIVWSAQPQQRSVGA